MKRYVQHISGQGEKWEVVGDDSSGEWGVQAKDVRVVFNTRWLPKSEYRLCDPPEKWVDVTGGVEIRGGISKQTGRATEFVYHGDAHLADLVCGGNYRLRKISWQNRIDDTEYGFIVEKKVSNE